MRMGRIKGRNTQKEMTMHNKELEREKEENNETQVYSHF